MKYIVVVFLLIFSGCNSKPSNTAPIAKILASSSVHGEEEVSLDDIMSTDDDGKIVA